MVSQYRRLVVTGGAGFIGSNFILRLLQEFDDIQVLNLDKLTYAGNLENLAAVENSPRYRFFEGDVAKHGDVQNAFSMGRDVFGGPFDAVVHFAAESHVDRSIEDPTAFLQTNVIGTQVVLDISRKENVRRFVHVSTDEVYGSLGSEGAFHEEMPIAPNSPYSASKAGSDLIARAYHKTYDFPVLITRCSNNYGPRQFPEKLIPLMIANALENLPLPVYGDGQNTRDWIHVDDHCGGVLAVLHAGRPGEVYNIGGNAERTNLEVVKTILQALDKSENLIRFVADRPGHDRRYAMDTRKIESELGWKPTWNFEDGLQATIKWYLANKDWMERIRTGVYRDYCSRMYGERDLWLKTI